MNMCPKFYIVHICTSYFVCTFCSGNVFLYNRLIENSEQLCMDKTDPWTFAQVQYEDNGFPQFWLWK